MDLLAAVDLCAHYSEEESYSAEGAAEWPHRSSEELDLGLSVGWHCVRCAGRVV